MPVRPTVEDLEALALRIGTVERAEHNEGARDPAYELWVDVGEEQDVQSSAKITEFYDAEALVGRQVIVETGFEPIRVGSFRSDVLVIGALTLEGVVLLKPDKPVPPGSTIA
jgi:tRNA-binding protein